MRTSVLKHTANIEDEATGDAFEEFRFTTVTGEMRGVLIERGRADMAKEVRRELLRKNARLDSDVSRSLEDVQDAIDEPPAAYLRYSARTGWRDDNTAFVTPWEAIVSPEKQRLKILPPRRTDNSQRSIERPQGDVAVWSKYVAGLCGYSDVGIVLICAAFAAPLLKFLGRPSFGLHVYGGAKRGKSTMLLAAESVGGVGNEEELPNWRATEASLPELCRLHCDRFFPINEAGLVAKGTRFAKIQRSVYQIAESREPDRHSGSGFAVIDGSATYRTIFASTAEHSIEHYARFSGETRDDGDVARCPDVAACRGSSETVFDRFPANVDPAKRLEWARKALTYIRNTCKKNHGVALPPFLRFIMAHLPNAMRKASAYRENFRAGYQGRKMSEAAHHIVENFAVVYAGGCLAVDAGMLKYKKADIQRAIDRCLGHALNRGASERDDALDRAKKILRAKLLGSRIADGDGDFIADNVDGFCTDNKSRFVVRARSMRHWFSKEPIGFRLIIAWLHERGFLKPRQSRSSGALENRQCDWAETTPKWPGRRGVVTRSIVFDSPFRNETSARSRN